MTKFLILGLLSLVVSRVLHWDGAGDQCSLASDTASGKPSIRAAGGPAPAVNAEGALTSPCPKPEPSAELPWILL